MDSNLGWLLCISYILHCFRTFQYWLRSCPTMAWGWYQQPMAPCRKLETVAGGGFLNPIWRPTCWASNAAGAGLPLVHVTIPRALPSAWQTAGFLLLRFVLLQLGQIWIWLSSTQQPTHTCCSFSCGSKKPSAALCLSEVLRADPIQAPLPLFPPL